jgi:hypothetical protein
MLIVSVDSTSTLTIYYSGHCETVVNSRLLQLDDACQILLDGNTIDFHQKVKKLGLIMNSELMWDDQISKICQNVFFWTPELYGLY